MKKKVIISACLLGEYCRYDGETKTVNEIVEKYRDYEIIPFCPEAPIFGTPRDKISVVHVDGKDRVIVDKTNIDVTDLLENEVENFIQKNLHVDEIILKSKSPSCGVGTTPVLNKTEEKIRLGDGIAARIFKQKYTNIDIHDETNFL